MPLSTQTALAACALAFTALAPPTHAAIATTAPDAFDAPAALASSAGADAPDPAAAPAGAATPPPSCSATLARARAAGGPMTPAEANALFDDVGRALRASPACAPEVAAWLESAPCDAQSTGTVAAAAAAHEGFTSGVALVRRAEREADRGALGCVRTLLPALQQSARVDEELAVAVRRVAGRREQDAREAGWLVLGTLANTAREERPAVAARVDAMIAAGLARASEGELRLLVEAAGNAGCDGPCAPGVARASRASDPALRRVAAGARRFVDTSRGVEHGCAALADADASVREHAAWALGWGEAFEARRVACLGAALTSDRSVDVRRAAARSLAGLSPASEDAERALASAATDPASPDAVRTIAWEHFSAQRAKVTTEGEGR